MNTFEPGGFHSSGSSVNPTQTELKKCSGCKLSKPLTTEYFKQRPFGGGFYARCLDCGRRDAEYRGRRAAQTPATPPANLPENRPPAITQASPSGYLANRVLGVRTRAQTVQLESPDRPAPQVRIRRPRGGKRDFTGPKAFLSEFDPQLPAHDIGDIDNQCEKCGAFHFDGEAVKKVFGSKCCIYGDVQLKMMKTPPRLFDLWASQDSRGREFRKNIRAYNNSFAFTSFGSSDEDKRINPSRGGIRAFTVHGTCFHRQGPLFERLGEKPRFCQMFFHDPEYATDIRKERSPELNTEILRSLHDLLMEHNPHIQMYKTARERLQEALRAGNSPFRVLMTPQMRVVLQHGNDRNRENLPSSNEIAGILPDEVENGPRDFVLAYRGAIPDLDPDFTPDPPELGASNSTNYGPGITNADMRTIERNQEFFKSEGQRFRRLHVSHGLYMPLHYVLIFPYGEYGWHWNYTLASLWNRNRQKLRLGQRMWYRFYLHIRHTIAPDSSRHFGQFNPLFHAQRLFQQFLVDSWIACETTELSWLRNHQNNLRADVYLGIKDALDGGDASADQLGKKIILPSSHTGSERFMQQCYSDAMALVSKTGKPSFFITFTCNPKWPEIVRNLLPGQSAEDRPDITCRVFWLKCKALIQDLKDGVLGRYQSHVMTIEYQKRGLPHMHLLLNVHSSDYTFDTPGQIDEVVCAELPHHEWDPDGVLMDLVTNQMTHGPCGKENLEAICMTDKNGKKSHLCNKHFPKDFCEETSIPRQNDAYPTYRRRNDGRTFIKKLPKRDSNGRTEVQYDNRWVVPYNPFLLRKYRAHINVEVCATLDAVKYLHKYIHKGVDRTTVVAYEKNDEITNYESARYVSSSEAFWRLMEFDTHQIEPPVTRLAVHLENMHTIHFNDGLSTQQLMEKMAESRSTLMAWFAYNKKHTGRTKLTVDGQAIKHQKDLSHMLYADFPSVAVWHADKKKWKLRKKGIAFGRMYQASMFSGERYYLRLLLTQIPGATSYEDLKIYEGVQYPSFRDACVARGIADNDQEWELALEEGKNFKSGASLRILFVTGLRMNLISDANSLWNKYKDALSDDLPKKLRDLQHQRGLNLPENLEDPHNDYALYLIEAGLKDETTNYAKSLSDFNLPEVQFSWQDWLPIEGEEYDYVVELSKANQMIPQLNTDQKACFDAITDAITTSPETAHFYLQGPGGSGKTFLYMALCHYYRGQSKIVLCVASTGVAALLLPGGTTSHSAFCIPLELSSVSICGIKKQSKAAALLLRVDLIIWDEVPMQHKYCFEAVHRLFCDLKNIDENTGPLFGGTPAVLGGDFAQTLPVIPKASRPDIVRMSLRKSWIWPRLNKLALTVNMRVRANPEAQESEIDIANRLNFVEWLGRLSYDPQLQGPISLPEYVSQPASIQDLILKVYPKDLLKEASYPPEFEAQGFNNTPLRGRALLATKNIAVAELNKLVLSSFPGTSKILSSVDSQLSDDGDAYRQPDEVLKAIELASLPPSRMELKIGCPVILMRNLSPKDGLCNGTRLIILKIRKHILECMILGGEKHGEIRHIPRIPLQTKQGECAWVQQRKQFPVKLSFAMTINKSQGQSLSTVGVDLRDPCFSHGQFYVAMSRSSNVKELYVYLDPKAEGKTLNVVYPEVLEGLGTDEY
jgi:hypothetical protein